jgi:tRNA-splicing ligase RtcB (3'-phosphate/5'-hydroxy nucleic acid ligase)
MIELRGKYNIAKVFTNNIEESAISQIINLLNQDFVENAKIRIMSDVHNGAGCVIGFTADLGNKIVPNLIGVDISCGMEVVELKHINLDLEKLDSIIHNYIPAGREVHRNIVKKFNKTQDLFCARELKDTTRIDHSVGTLGGGNHMIEVAKDDRDEYYLVIHSGSRNLGKQVAEYYQKLAIESCKGLGDWNTLKTDLIDKLKLEGKKSQIQFEINKLEKKFKNTQPNYPEDLCFLEGKSRDDYLHDMTLCQEYATLNRKTMAKIILKEMFHKDLSEFDGFETIHNYIDFKDNIIRKGAVSAYSGEQLIIPINMRDGSILATGKGNPDWNNSAPHGAGRLMGRNEAKRSLSMQEFADTMKDVYSTTVNNSTLDEAPMAYKPIQEIIDNIQDTVTIDKIIKPVYNFKASE